MTDPSSSSSSSLRIEGFDVFVFRAPADPPVQTSFGIMRDRPAVLVRLTDAEGRAGWGEIWCNFPTVGAEHRARLALAYGKPVLMQQPWAHPREAFAELTRRLAVLALQTGEHGPLHQVVAGIDAALWDLHARRAGQPLWKALGGATAQPVQVYASGLNPTEPEKLALQKRDEGYRAFKLKVGFGAERDLANLRAMREALGREAAMMVDANQAWDFEESVRAGHRMAEFNLLWLEEPLRADQPAERWQALAKAQPLRLAGGENLAGLAQYRDFIATEGMSVMQPDLGKWGGFTGCLTVAQETIAAGKWYCPHWLGGGIGLVASMHLKTAVGGPGYVEVDSNPNPLRELLAVPAFAIHEGFVQLGDAPGLGVAPDLDSCRDFLVAVPASGL
ncbi:Mandelate racemase [Variovorax sp. PBL-H6]|uniref:mandelate racemase/muconate lactonizing enzyme family protein n=1 Tax=Variovorax sp. PBL-H6 TaxID=434009 RepID=UPI0013199C30|nr:mandelate racemase/muconate lactonizing enzyme family protein [Variovorax sp. PBL-H6]VTU38084.1 Mandelate racemase [Variovorax sp. PBL-H6]